MLIQTKQSNPNIAKQFALFNLGFRPFFLGGSVFAVVLIVAWMLLYFAQNTLSMTNITVSQWHAHEMLYGYGMAVVAGFLLTAVKNWTGIPTLYGKQLMILFGLWCLARVSLLFGTALLVTTQFYTHLVLVAAILWCVSFTVFVWIYAPIVIKPRVDGAFG